MTETGWLSLSEAENYLDTSRDQFALVWARLYVRSLDRDWWTTWKFLRGAWIHWLGDRVNGSPTRAENWYIPTSPDTSLRIEKWEITHFRLIGPPDV